MIYFITGNKDKFNEAKEVIPDLDFISLGLDEIQELDSKKIIEHKVKEALKYTVVLLSLMMLVLN